MKTNVLLVLASLALSAATALADPGGQPNLNARKKRSRVEAAQRADEVRVIAIGGYRQENLYEAGERWRADKAAVARDAKASRDREAQERLAREETRRGEVRARQDRERLAAAERRDAEKRRRDDAAKAKAEESERRAQAKRDKAADRQARR